MNFQDMKEQLLQQLKDLLEKIKSSAFNELKDRYENLTLEIKTLIISLSLIVAFWLFQSPGVTTVLAKTIWLLFWKHDLIEMFNDSREVQEGAPLPIAPWRWTTTHAKLKMN